MNMHCNLKILLKGLFLNTICIKAGVQDLLPISLLLIYVYCECTLYRLTQEFAGLGGNIGFFKNELEVQVLSRVWGNYIYLKYRLIYGNREKRSLLGNF